MYWMDCPTPIARDHPPRPETCQHHADQARPGGIDRFGIAQIVGGTQYTVSGALMGTLSYMAPEQGLSGHCDARSDIYSCGITYYEALTGSVPFDADTPLAILMKHINDPLPIPASWIHPSRNRSSVLHSKPYPRRRTIASRARRRWQRR